MLGSPVPQHIWSSIWKKVLGSVSAQWWDFKDYSLGFPLKIPGQLISSSICNQIASLFSCQCCLFCLVKLGMLLSLGLGWLGPLQGLNNLKIPPPSYLWCHKTCTQRRQSGHTARAVFRQVRSKGRGPLCFVSEACLTSPNSCHLVIVMHMPPK